MSIHNILHYAFKYSDGLKDGSYTLKELIKLQKEKTGIEADAIRAVIARNTTSDDDDYIERWKENRANNRYK